jgi:hypothetical protein
VLLRAISLTSLLSADGERGGDREQPSFEIFSCRTSRGLLLLRCLPRDRQTCLPIAYLQPSLETFRLRLVCRLALSFLLTESAS